MGDPVRRRGRSDRLAGAEEEAAACAGDCRYHRVDDDGCMLGPRRGRFQATGSGKPPTQTERTRL